VSQAVSYLFVPGSCADRFEKALAAQPDRVIIDLEDAVDPADKGSARDAVVAALRAGLAAPILVRINGDDTEWFEGDLAALGALVHETPGRLAGVVIPKIESVVTIARAREALGADESVEIIGLIESAVGVHAVDELAAGGVSRLAIGGIDLSVDLGSDVVSPLSDYVYAKVVIASRIAGIPAPIASPPLELRDAAGIEAAARRLKSMGVGAQLCIHPAQLGAVHAAFAPTDAEIDWARRVLASEGAAAQVDGQMVDKPVRDRAERIIALAERASS